MAEMKRGCGWRKINGLYLVGGEGPGLACCKLPIPLHTCPTCHGGIKQTRGWQWIDPSPWLKGQCSAGVGMSIICPASDPDRLGDRVGLLWIGGGFYPTTQAFLAEAAQQGISRRIKAIPRGFKVGEHWVFLAHPTAIPALTFQGEPQPAMPGVFRIFKPTRIEKIITETMSKDADVMAELEKQGITPVIVADDDKRHQGSVFDDDQEDLPLEEAPHA